MDLAISQLRDVRRIRKELLRKMAWKTTCIRQFMTLKTRTTLWVWRMSKRQMRCVYQLVAFCCTDRQYQAAVHHSNVLDEGPIVEYHVLYSVSYQVPVLYLQLHHLPPNAPKGLNALYQVLVPENVEPGIRSSGIMGGISMEVRALSSVQLCFG